MEEELGKLLADGQLTTAFVAVVATLVTMVLTKALGRVKQFVLKTETKVDDKLLEAIVGKLKEQENEPNES